MRQEFNFKIVILTEMTEIAETTELVENPKVEVTKLAEATEDIPSVSITQVKLDKPEELSSLVSVKRASPKDHSYEILAAFKNETEALHITEIAKRTGITNHSTCSNALAKVIDKGVLKRAKRGWFYDPRFCKNPLVAKQNGMEFAGLIAH